MESLLSSAVKRCPFLARTPVAQLRHLSTTTTTTTAAAPNPSPFPAASSALMGAARSCPVFGKALNVVSLTSTSTASLHSATRTANASLVTEPTVVVPTPPPLLETTIATSTTASTTTSTTASTTASATTSTTATTPSFDYESFYSQELDKKHKDKSYRYFNNINRLAQQFPLAHTAAGEHSKVTVWCSNDYLGMSKHPEVVHAMK